MDGWHGPHDGRYGRRYDGWHGPHDGRMAGGMMGGMDPMMAGVFGPDTDPMGGMFGPDPMGDMFGPDPMGGMFGPDPMGGMFGPDPMGGMFGPDPMGESLDLIQLLGLHQLEEEPVVAPR